MSPKYKLTYFKTKGRAEPIRLLLAYGKQEYEENFVEKAQWPQLKKTVPFGKLPVLEVDGKQLHQSIAICRYLAKKFGLAGSNDEEALQIDTIADTFQDLASEMKKTFGSQDEEAKAAAKNTFITESFPYYASKFEAIVIDNGGYFVNGKLSWADIVFAHNIGNLMSMLGLPDLLDKYPNLKSLPKKVFEEPNIKIWLSERVPIP